MSLPIRRRVRSAAYDRLLRYVAIDIKPATVCPYETTYFVHAVRATIDFVACHKFDNGVFFAVLVVALDDQINPLRCHFIH